MSLIARSKLSQLVVIDVQERLAGVMPSDEMQMVIKNCSILLQAAKLLEVPVIMTEQYPKGLGATVPKLLALLGSKRPVEKITFSCTNESKFTSNLTLDRSQIVLAGMEAHICVLQTLATFSEKSPSPITQARLPGNAEAIELKYDGGKIVCRVKH